MISNTNKLRKTSGFTIVELLIVIVVIGILAAITIVAYNGVQARANNTKLDTLAKEIADKAEVYAADNDGVYPATVTAYKALTSSSTAQLSSGANGAIQAALVTSSTAGKIHFCANATGYRVVPYDYVAKGAQTDTAKIRTGGTPGTCSAT